MTTPQNMPPGPPANAASPMRANRTKTKARTMANLRRRQRAGKDAGA